MHGMIGIPNHHLTNSMHLTNPSSANVGRCFQHGLGTLPRGAANSVRLPRPANSHHRCAIRHESTRVTIRWGLCVATQFTIFFLMLRHVRFLQFTLVVAFTALFGCSSNPSAPGPSGNSGNGNTPVTSNLGSFKVAINHDTLDRSQYQNTCFAEAGFILAEPYAFSLDLFFSRTQLRGMDDVHIGLAGNMNAPLPGTYPIVSFDLSTGIDGDLDSMGIQYGSLDGGSLTITKFDTINNLVSGTFRMVTAVRWPAPDPTKQDTVAGSFTNVGIYRNMFGQGSMSATIAGTPFKPVLSTQPSLIAFTTPGTGVLEIDGDTWNTNGELKLILTIDSPRVGTFPFGNGTTPGTANLAYDPSHIYYSTQGQQNCGALTITAYDPINRRISAHFTSTPLLVGSDTTLTITDGVIDNVTWLVE